MNRAGAAACPARRTKPRPPEKTTPVAPPGTLIVSACFRPLPSYSVLELRASFATHHGPVELAASPQALTSSASPRSETSVRAVKRSKRALLAEPAAASATSATASAPALIYAAAIGDGRGAPCRLPI